MFAMDTAKLNSGKFIRANLNVAGINVFLRLNLSVKFAF